MAAKQTYIFKTIVKLNVYDDMPDFVLRRLRINHHNIADRLNITNVYDHFLPFMTKFELRYYKYTRLIVDYIKAVDWYLGILVIDFTYFSRRGVNTARCRSYVKYMLFYT